MMPLHLLFKSDESLREAIDDLRDDEIDHAISETQSSLASLFAIVDATVGLQASKTSNDSNNNNNNNDNNNNNNDHNNNTNNNDSCEFCDYDNNSTISDNNGDNGDNNDNNHNRSNSNISSTSHFSGITKRGTMVFNTMPCIYSDNEAEEEDDDDDDMDDDNNSLNNNYTIGTSDIDSGFGSVSGGSISGQSIETMDTLATDHNMEDTYNDRRNNGNNNTDGNNNDLYDNGLATDRSEWHDTGLNSNKVRNSFTKLQIRHKRESTLEINKMMNSVYSNNSNVDKTNNTHSNNGNINDGNNNVGSNSDHNRVPKRLRSHLKSRWGSLYMITNKFEDNFPFSKLNPCDVSYLHKIVRKDYNKIDIIRCNDHNHSRHHQGHNHGRKLMVKIYYNGMRLPTIYKFSVRNNSSIQIPYNMDDIITQYNMKLIKSGCKGNVTNVFVTRGIRLF